MPRNLADVADYFLPRAGGAVPPGRGPREWRESRAPLRERPAALPIVAVPMGDRDVVRAALEWNLVVEVARLGASAALLAPLDDEPSPLWPESGPGPVGTEVVLVSAQDSADLARAALYLAVARAA